MSRQFDVVIERGEEGIYVATVPQLEGCHTQARSLNQLVERVREAIELCLEVKGARYRVWYFRQVHSAQQGASKNRD